MYAERTFSEAFPRLALVREGRGPAGGGDRSDGALGRGGLDHPIRPMKRRSDRGLGICVIGRNEAQRLPLALASVSDRGEARVYVDSASTDRSVEIAKEFDSSVDLVRCTSVRCCTAARGRNMGFRHLRKQVRGLKFVQFIDGDCVLMDGWLDAAVEMMEQNPDVAIVAGRLAEEDRNRNVYHRLADMEWQSPVGDVDTVGGIFLMRAEVFAQVGGMDPSMGQGEEADLARRVRALGHRVVRLPVEMARHDIAMEHFGQWWTRATREGKATTQTVLRNGMNDAESVRHLVSMMAWGAGVPTVAATLLLPTLGLSVGVLGAYGRLWGRIRTHRMEVFGDLSHDAALYATFTVLGKIANATGCLRYLGRRSVERVQHKIAQRLAQAVGWGWSGGATSSGAMPRPQRAEPVSVGRVDAVG